MQKFNNTSEAIGNGYGEYDEVTEPFRNYEAAQHAADEINDSNWEEAYVIQVGEDYRVGIRHIDGTRPR